MSHDFITVARANLTFLGCNIPWTNPWNDAWRPLATPQSVSKRDTFLTSLVTTGHTHVSQMYVARIYLKCSRVLSLHCGMAFVTCSLGTWFARLLDVTGGREDWVHGHLI